MRTRIKICGLTRPEDVAVAVEAGADAIGLVFCASSPRAVTISQAVELARQVPPFVSVVGLFVDATVTEISAILQAVPLSLLQFHGEEAPEYCQQFKRPWIKAVRVQPGLDLLQYRARYVGARGLLLDAYVPGLAGGTGKVFDWDLIPAELARSIVLAGGLNPDNVAAAVRQARPWAVDVSGGVESAKGIKDAAKIAAFVDAVRAADA